MNRNRGHCLDTAVTGLAIIASWRAGRERNAHQPKCARRTAMRARKKRTIPRVCRVNWTLSLAFLAPDLVKAAIDGRLPHGMGVVRLTGLPAEWSRQRRILGFASH
jgi:hypothetical protein